MSTLSAQPSLKVSPQSSLAPPEPQGALWTPYPKPNSRTPSCLFPPPQCLSGSQAGGLQHLSPHWRCLQVSKAMTLQKTAEYITMLQQERATLQEEAQQLRDQIEELNAAIK